MTILFQKAYAQAPQLDEGAGGVQAEQVGASEVLMPNLLLILAIIGLFVILVYLPQKRRNKEHNEMLGQLGDGDKVVTSGGMVGTITSVPGESELIIETGEGHKVTILKAAVSGKYEDIVSPGDSSKKSK